MCLAQGQQRSDAGEARTRGPSVLSQALYHWATALPALFSGMIVLCNSKTEILFTRSNYLEYASK